MSVSSNSSYLTVGPLPRTPRPPHPAVVSANLNYTPQVPLPLTKAVVTVGPACEDPKTLRELIQGGVTGFRYNMSHVLDEKTLARTLRSVLMLRYLAHQERKEIAVFADMQGSEFRVRSSADIPIRPGDEVRLTTEEGLSHRHGRTVTLHLSAPKGYKLINDLRKNERIFSSHPHPRPIVYIDDGNVAIELNPWKDLFDRRSPETHFRGMVCYGDCLRKNKGVNFPGLSLPNLPGMTSADHRILQHIFDKDFVEESWNVLTRRKREIGTIVADAMTKGVFHLMGFDYIAPSFVRTPKDLDRFQHFLEGILAKHVGLIPKIETLEAIQTKTLRALMGHPLTRGLMVARGDLAAQVGRRRVPYYQRLILNMAREAGRFSIVATDVLGSMTHGTPHATRAEHDGLFSMVEYGAHAFMLSNETAGGEAPVDVARYALETFTDEKMEPAIFDFDMRAAQQARVLAMREKEFNEMLKDPQASPEAKEQADLYLDLMKTTQKAQHDPFIDGLVLWSHRGESMRRAAQILSGIPIFVVTDHLRVAREAVMTRGIYPILLSERPKNGKQLERIIKATLFAPPGKKSARLKVMHNLG
jgi:pyruvate kinase